MINFASGIYFGKHVILHSNQLYPKTYTYKILIHSKPRLPFADKRTQNVPAGQFRELNNKIGSEFANLAIEFNDVLFKLGQRKKIKASLAH